MENFGTAIDATATAEGASGSAMRENEKAMDSIEKKTNRLITQFQKLVWGEKGGLNDLLKHLIDLATLMLKFANSDIGKVVISITAVITVGNLLNLALAGISKKFTEIAIKSGAMAGELMFVNGALVSTTTATLTLKSAFQALGTAMKSHPILLIASTLAGVYSIIQSNKSATDELSKSVSQLASEYQQAEHNVEDIENKLKNVNKAINDINNNKNIEITDNKQLELLIAERIELENQLKLQQELADERKKELEAKFKKEYSGKKTVKAPLTLKSRVKAPSEEEIFEELMPRYTKASEKVSEYTAKLAELERQNKKNTNEYKNTKDKLVEARKEYDNLKESLLPTIEKMQEFIKGMGVNSENLSKYSAYTQKIYNDLSVFESGLVRTEEEVSNTSKELITMGSVAESLGVSYNTLKNAIGELEWDAVLEDFYEYNDGLEDGEITIEEYIQKNYDLKGSIEDTATAFKDWNEAIDSIQSSYDTLNNIVDSYNELGGYTVDNLQDLLALSPEYLSMLSMENGQLVLNTQALQDKIIAQAEESKAIIYDTAVKKLNELASNAQQTSSKNAGDEGLNSASKWDTETEALNRNNVAKATYNALRSGASESDVNQVLKDMQLELDAVDSLVNSLTLDFSKGMGKSAKSTNKATDSVKELNKELEDLKSKYEKVISIIDKKLEKMMDNLEKEKDKVIDGIEDQINALKKLQKAEVDGYKKQIDYLQEMQQKEEDYWNDKINALKAQNEEMEEQNQLMKLQEALALAQASRVKVMKDGKFQYVQDDKAVDKARQDLVNYTNEQAYNKQLELLEKMKKQAVSSYDSQIVDLQNFVNNLNDKYEQQIEDLEALKDAKEKSFEEQIAQIQAYKDEFDEMVNAYQEEQDRLLVEQMTGINIEAQNWEQRLNNLADFVNEYNSILAQLGTDNTNVSSNYSGTRASDYETVKSGAKEKVVTTKTPPSTSDVLGDIWKNVRTMQNTAYGTEYQKAQQSKYYEQYASSKVKAEKEEEEKRKKEEEEKRKKTKQIYISLPSYSSHASGIGSIDSNELALVGENPNKELIIGSKLNGQLMNLTKGSGVVNASSTRTVAGLLNSLGKTGALTSGANYTANNNSTNTTQNFEFGNISLPNVKDANSFVSELANNFKEYAVQNSHR